MKKAPAPTLIGGPYRPPAGRAYRVGRTVGDRLRGEVTVYGLSDAPIQWPVARTLPHSRPMPVMTRDLTRAVKTESVEALAYHWGVSRYTVRHWRHALGVDRFNSGTLAVWRELAPKLHTAKARSNHRAAMRDSAARRRATATTSST